MSLSRPGAILVLCCTAQFMVILDIAVVNVALPSIRGSLGFGPTELPWVVNAYAITFAGLLLLGGRAADLLGRRRMFALGMLVLAGASLLAGLAPDRWVLVAGRALQGVGGAIVAPATLSILSTTFAEGEPRNRALGAWGAMNGVGGSAGVLLGGVLVETLDWRWVFFVNVPIGLVAVAVALRLLAGHDEVDSEHRRGGFDVAGALTVTLGLLALVLGIVQSEQHGWGAPATLAPAGLGIALLAGFVAIERRFASRPLVPLRIFASRRLTGANLVVFAFGSTVFAMWFLASLYMQEVLDLTALQTGLAFLPMSVLIVVGSTAAGRITGRVGPGPLLAVGAGTLAVGMLLFTRISADGSWAADVLLPGVVCAAGIGMMVVPSTIAAVSGVSRADAGLASGLVNTSRQVGGALGLAVLATVAASHTAGLRGDVPAAEALAAGYERAFAVGAGFAAAGLLAALLLVPLRVQQ